MTVLNVWPDTGASDSVAGRMIATSSMTSASLISASWRLLRRRATRSSFVLASRASRDRPSSIVGTIRLRW